MLCCFDRHLPFHRIEEVLQRLGHLLMGLWTQSTSQITINDKIIRIKLLFNSTLICAHSGFFCFFLLYIQSINDSSQLKLEFEAF